MKETNKLAHDIAVQFIDKPKRLGMSEVDYHNARDAYDFNVESATNSIAFALVHDRAQIRAEVTEISARIAETEYATDPKWDRPVYNAKGSGNWIATAIRSTLTRSVKTNNPKRASSMKERDDDHPTSESQRDIAGHGRANSQTARKAAA